RRPGGLCRRRPARLRQPDHPQAQQHLPHCLRAQPDAAGQGRPDRAQGPEDRRDGLQRHRPGQAALRNPAPGQAGRSGPVPSEV
ncbi:MAG: Murein hydrolase activator NlpD, partial [uncultured Ramlibacter sp.]